MQVDDNSSDLFGCSFKAFENRNKSLPNIPSDIHTILFDLPLPDDITKHPTPRIGGDKWDDSHVKLATSPFCKYFEIDENEERNKKLRWNLIKESLTITTITNSRELEEAIGKYLSRNSETNFSSLHQLFEEEFLEEDSLMFFTSVMPKMIELALRLPELIRSPIPFLKQKTNHSISLAQEQAACLLANAFFCTFPGRNGARKNTDYPEINFNRLFSGTANQVVEKLKCLCHYFKRVCGDMPTGVLTFRRRYIDKDDFPNFSESGVKLASVKIAMSSKVKIEDGAGMLQVDFANRYLGGGVLGWGCVQEEIRFVINPEMIVGMLFCESMNSTEAIVMTGCEQFSKYTGYASSFKWAGNFKDETPRDIFRRRMIKVVAIDAISFHKPHLQFEEFAIAREVRKAFVGFYHDPEDASEPIPICSGNWGCGAFRGNKPMKALIQLIACCINRRNLFYCSFGEHEMINQVTEMYAFLEKYEITVGTLWKFLKAFKEKKMTDRPNELYSFIYRQHSKLVLLPGLRMADSDSEENNIEVATTLTPLQGGTEIQRAKKQRISEEDESPDFETENLSSLLENLNEKVINPDVETVLVDSKPDDQVSSKPEEATRQPDDQLTSNPEAEATRKPEEEHVAIEIDNPSAARKDKITDYFKLR